MADILDKLLPASFRGAEFYIRTSDITGGRKTITHEYPLSDTRFVEDVGKLEKTFAVTGIISEPNYFSKKTALINALETEGQGILSLPFFGSLLVNLAGVYTLTEDITNLGIANFTMTFQKASRNITPTETAQNESLIQDIADTVIANTQENLADNFSLDSKNAANFTTAASKVNDIADFFDDAKKKADQVADKINEFESALLDFRNEISELINIPSDLATSITGLFNSLNVLAKDPIGQIDMFKAFYNFGGDDTEVTQNTVSRIERANNNQLLNENILAASLAFTYSNIIDLTFNTTDDIDNIKNLLETQYSAIIDSIKDPTTFDNIQALRNEARKFLDRQRAVAFRITTVKTNATAGIPFVYKYYGNLENYEQILSLNNIIEPAFLEGELNILTK